MGRLTRRSAIGTAALGATGMAFVDKAQAQPATPTKRTFGFRIT